MKLLCSSLWRAGGQKQPGKTNFSESRRQAVRFYLPAAPLRSAAKRITAPILRAGLVSSFALFAQVTSAQQQPQPSDSIAGEKLDAVIVQAVRATGKTPVTFSNVKASEIAPRNLGQDIPQLLNFLPSVVTTSDAGNAIGYSGIRVRGSDATRVNVTINGVPYNDSESMGTFWVNMPDFASSAESIQLQRGVGTSTNGSGAFGASLNVLTDSYSEKASGEISNSFGSFATRKHTVKFSSGLMGEHFELAGRLSNIESDGYIDRASSSLKGYFLQGTYVNKGTMIKALVFGGTQTSYQAWNGLEDPEKLANDRTYNTAGEYVDDQGITRFYDNQTDNYNQDHYQLHWTQRFGKGWSTALALHYTIGKGYYENYRTERDITEYGLVPQEIGGVEVSESDLIDQKWLDNDFYGTTFSVNYKNAKVDAMIGGGWNEYDGDHFGKVLWTRSVVLPMYGQEYYRDKATKRDFNAFARASVNLNNWLSVFADLQLRKVSYDANSLDTGYVRDRFDFFNPKAGFTITASEKSNIYFSFARAHREPNRTDYESGSPKPERLDDFELGWRFASAKTRLNINAYFMNYKDQLVLTGGLNDVGAPIRANSGKSYRAGIEVEGVFQVSEKWFLRPNLTLSQNKNRDFFFQRDGVLTNLGNTDIAFSPEVIFGNAITFRPIQNLDVTLLSKYVGKQFMGNIDSEASALDAYATTDLNVSYEWKTKSFFQSIILNGLVNNIFNTKYESNGYFYTFDDDWSNPGSVSTMEGAGFYPQARLNFLVGLTLKF